MKKFSVFLTVVAGLCLCYAQTASALAMYDASSTLTITVLDATDIFFIDSYGTPFADPSLNFTVGDASATAGFDFTVNGTSVPFDPFFQEYYSPLSVGDIAVWSSFVSGSAVNGFAQSSMVLDAVIDVFGEDDGLGLLGEVNFSWEYTIAASASVDDLAVELASSGAIVDILDDYGYVDVLDQVVDTDVLNSITMSGTWQVFTDFGSDTIISFLDTSGMADGVPPDPGTGVPDASIFLLLGPSLIGLVGFGRRSKK